MPDVPVEKRFDILCDIARAQHFAWREAVVRCCPDVDAGDAVRRMWEVTGEQTGKAYLRRIRPDEPLAPQVARSIAWSSHCMGEDAAVEPGKGDEAFVRHRACPWLGWHERMGLVEEDRPGCDAWFQSTVHTINEALGTKLRVETLEALPECGASCLRRLWVD